MIRTQIQLPDETLARAKKVCEAREISMAELARRRSTAEEMIYPERTRFIPKEPDLKELRGNGVTFR